jgi:hypothetical protein
MIKSEIRNSTGLHGVSSQRTSTLQSHHQLHKYIQYICGSNAYVDQVLLDKPQVALLQHARQLLNNVRLNLLAPEFGI